MVTSLGLVAVGRARGLSSVAATGWRVGTSSLHEQLCGAEPLGMELGLKGSPSP